MAKFTIAIPHWKTGKMTAYAVSRFLKFAGKHEIEIIIVDNNAGDGSIEYLEPFGDKIKIYSYPKDRLQSHGISLSWLIDNGYINTDWFITAESDSYPTAENWLDYYEDLINKGFDAAGSHLHLSGGRYFHPAGMLYNMNVYKEAKAYCDSIPYKYVNNLAMFQDFPCHCMIHNSIWDDFLKHPREYINLNPSITADEIEKMCDAYKPTVCVFHNGMGGRHESLST